MKLKKKLIVFFNGSYVSIIVVVPYWVNKNIQYG